MCNSLISRIMVFTTMNLKAYHYREGGQI